MRRDFTTSAASDKTGELRALLGAVSTALGEAAFLPGTSPEAPGMRALGRAKRIVESKLAVEVEADFATPLVAAVLGGTNVGKSTLFNATLESAVSSIDPRAGHTVCAVAAAPAASCEAATRLFSGYRVVEGRAGAGADVDDDCVFVAETPTPGDAVVIDSPDVDSALNVHHVRAYDALIASDVVLFVTSPTKYNDKRCVDVLRDAIAMGKRLVVLFNLLPPEDDAARGGSRGEILRDFSRSVPGARTAEVLTFAAVPGAGPDDVARELAAGAGAARAALTEAAASRAKTKRSVCAAGAAYLVQYLKEPLAELRAQAQSLDATRAAGDRIASGARDDYLAYLRGREFLELEVVLRRLLDRFRVPVLDDALDLISAVPRWLAGAILRRPTLDDRMAAADAERRDKELELLGRARVAFAKSLEERSGDEAARYLYGRIVSVDYFTRDLAADLAARDEARSSERAAWLKGFEGELVGTIESSPGVRTLIKSVRAVLELGSGIAAAVLTGGIGTGDLLWAPAAGKAAQAIVSTVGNRYFDDKRREYVRLQAASFEAAAEAALFARLREGIPTTPRVDVVEELSRDVRRLAKVFGGI